MPSWSELLNEVIGKREEELASFVGKKTGETLRRIAFLYDRNVLFYASAFLQKPTLPTPFAGIVREDINGFMSAVYGVDAKKGLLLMLHTPGGLAEAAQTIVAYLRSNFEEIDALVPTYAMSAGTMVALGCDRIIMGPQSQLGPTDPQLIASGRAVSAHSIVSQFEQAKAEIVGNPVLAHAWAPVLQSYGPALLQEARRALDYGKRVVREWLEQHMLAGQEEATEKAKAVAEHFSSDEHGQHGRRIDREEARAVGVEIVDLEQDQKRQDAVLTVYNLTTILFEYSPAAKVILSSNGSAWIKNVNQGPSKP